MAEFNLSAREIQTNWKTFRHLIDENFPTRKDALNRMYDDLEERAVMAPASSFEYFHNAIPGGYVDHVLRMYQFSIEVYEFWKKFGMITDTFTLEELSFAALHHDLGKLGLPGENREHYQFNDSKWHRENQGKMYKSNPNNPWLTTADTSIYLLNYYQIPYSLNEMLGIRLTDGMYDEANKGYLSGFNLDTKLRSNLPYILHQGDMMAFRWEFERWAKVTGKFTFGNENSLQSKLPEKSQEEVKPKIENPMDAFNKLFPGS